MKKIMCVILCILFIILSTPTFAVYETYYSDSDKIAFIDTIGLFESVGITDANDRADIATTVSRGKMAKLLANVLKLSPGQVTGKYTDIPDDYEYTQYIYAVAEHGYMVGVSETEFAPNSDVTFEQSIVLISRALGYDLLAEDRGGYPTGYIAIARENNLLNGIVGDGSNPIAYGSLVKLIMNAVSAPRLVLHPSKSEPTFSLDRDNTLMKSVWEIEELSGVITSTGDSRLYTGRFIRKDQVEIDGVVYETKCEVKDKLGCKIRYYKSLVRSENIVVYICNSNEYNTVVQVMSEDIIDLSGFTYLVDVEGRQKKYKFDGNTNIIFNGQPVKSLSKTDLVPNDGYIKLLDSDDDATFDVLFVWSFQTGVVEFVDNDGYRIYCDNSSFDLNNLKDTEELKVYNIDDEEIEFSVIKAPGIVSVAVDKDNKSAVIYYSDASVKGKLQSFDSEYFYIDDKAYRQKCGTGYSPQVGNMAVFYIDYAGIIRGFKMFDSENMLGMMINVKYRKDDMHIKIFNENGEMVNYHVNEKVKIDGVRYRDYNSAYNALLFNSQATINVDSTTVVVYDVGEVAVPQLVNFKLNSEGEIKEIDTPYNWKDNMLAGNAINANLNGSFDASYESANSMHIMSMTNRGYVSQQNSIDGYCLISGSTKVFVMPESADPSRSDSRKKAVKDADDMDFAIATQSQLPGNNKYFWCDAYSRDDKDFYAAALVCWSDMSAGQTTYGVVTKLYDTVDYAGDVSRGINIATTNASNQLQLTIRDGVNLGSVAIGDIVYITTNSKNEIIAGQRYYDYKNNSWYSAKLGPTEANSYASTTLAFVGNVYDVSEGAISVVATLDDWSVTPPSISDIQTKRIYNASKFNVLIFDASNKREPVRQGTYKDIIPYKSAGSNYSKIAMVTRNGDPRLLVVYR